MIQRVADKEMEADKMGKDISRQSKNDLRTGGPKNERLARPDIDFAEMNRGLQMLKKVCAEIVGARPRAAGNQNHVVGLRLRLGQKTDHHRKIVARVEVGYIIHARLATKRGDERRVAVPKLAQARHLFRRHDFIARGEMKNARTSGDGNRRLAQWRREAPARSRRA